jgi:4a-hydroxytetrahydrobiopterin dehydratase
MKKLNTQQAEKARAKLTPSWELVKGVILQKTYKFDDYDSVIKFFQDTKDIQVELDHFADFAFFYNELLVRITTKDVNGLTVLDYQLAKAIDIIKQ